MPVSASKNYALLSEKTCLSSVLVNLSYWFQMWLNDKLGSQAAKVAFSDFILDNTIY